jgi:hypothetical protein
MGGKAFGALPFNPECCSLHGVILPDRIAR